MKRSFIILHLSYLIVAGVPAAIAYSPPVPAQQVRDLSLTWTDKSRGREVPVKIYFPLEVASPVPVIIFSHGLGGTRDNYSYLGKHWAGCGYVSVHVQHLGSDDSVWRDLPLAERPRALQRAATDLSNARDRPLDVVFVIDQLARLQGQEGFPLKAKLDLQRCAAAGHSFGGFTTLAVAGQTFSLPLRGSMQYGDPRIKAAIQMSAPAPAARTKLDRAYGSISIPVMHMTGTKDYVEILPQTKPEDRRLPFDHMSASETCLVIFNGGDHMIFSGRERVANHTEAAQDAIFHRLILDGTTAFWDAYLKGNAGAKAWLLEGGYQKLLDRQATFEHKSPMPKP